MGGTSDNSFDEETQTGITVGYSITDDEEMTPEIEKYVRELAKRYGQDDRVIIWNIWNELGNSGRGEKSFRWLKSNRMVKGGRRKATIDNRNVGSAGKGKLL